jgi:hypothetical protein
MMIASVSLGPFELSQVLRDAQEMIRLPKAQPILRRLSENCELIWWERAGDKELPSKHDMKRASR